MVGRTEAPLRFELLGPLRAWSGGEELDLGPAKQRAVLAVLLINLNRPVPVTQIVDAVWQDEPPENGANVVQKYVSSLRRILEPDRSPRSAGLVVSLTEAGYRLSVPPSRVDVDVFHQLVRQAQDARERGDLVEASVLLRRGLALWTGTALAGLSGPYIDAARDRLVESRATALQLWAQVEVERGNHAEIVAPLLDLVGEFPLREELRCLLMLVLYRCGRQAEALAAFREARRVLAEEFGVEPGERLQELHRRILRSDPSLLVVEAAGVEPARDNGQGGAANASIGTPPAPVPLGPVIQAPTVAPYRRQAPPAAPASRWRWLGPTLAISIPIATCGFASWVVTAFYAVRRRSWRVGLLAVGHLALMTWFVIGMALPEPWLTIAMMSWIVAIGGGAVCGALLSRESMASRRLLDPAYQAALVAWSRREQARQIVQHHPVIARQLRIGRPDLVRTFDDGGLVDINATPASILASLPGVGPERSQWIVADRGVRGPFTSADDLARRGLIPPDAIPLLSDIVVAIVPADLSTTITDSPARAAGMT